MIYAVIFFTSCAVLGYEVTFARVFAYAQWQNLSSVIITMALLGSGAAGTAAYLAGRMIERNFPMSLFAASLLFPLFMAVCFIVSVMLPVNPYAMSFSPVQLIYISVYFLLMCLPFFAGSAVICLAFMKRPPSGVYAVNLFGSGAGGVLPLLLSFYMHPYGIIAVMVIIAFIPPVLLALQYRAKSAWTALAVAAALISSAVVISSGPGFRRVSEYKPVSGALNLPGGRIIHETYSPLSVVQVVEARGLRSATGLSLVSPCQVPEQRIIYFDGDSPSAITPFSGDPGEVKYLQYLSSWLPYYMTMANRGERALVIGAGGGEPLLKSIMAGLDRVDAVEINGAVISLMKNECAAYSGNIYLDKRLSIHRGEGRSFVRRCTGSYDLVDIPMIDAFNSASSGVYALNESSLYTVESFRDFYRRLTPRGILSITRWITTPPRDSLKVFNTAVTSLRGMNIADPGARLMVIRSLQTVTILVSASPFNAADIKRVKDFCSARLFDIVYYPGMRASEADRYIKQDGGLLYRSCVSLLSPYAADFVSSCEWDISAPSDNRPYFYNFFRPAVMRYISEYGARQFPVTEWGYLLLLIILAPVVIISFISILFPVTKMRLGGGGPVKNIVPYFGLIAAGYFFIEMPMIQNMALFLGSPVFSMGIIISTLLVSSGIGSMYSRSLFTGPGGFTRCAAVVCLIAVSYSLALGSLFSLFMGMPLYGRIIAVIIPAALAGFFMGILFPKGLSLLAESNGETVPFAWGVNGFFSVISIIAASVCAVVFGYKVVLACAAIFYIAAGMFRPVIIVKDGE